MRERRFLGHEIANPGRRRCRHAGMSSGAHAACGEDAAPEGEIVRRADPRRQRGRALPIVGAIALAARDILRARVEHLVLEMAGREFRADRVSCQLQKLDARHRAHRGRNLRQRNHVGDLGIAEILDRGRQPSRRTVRPSMTLCVCIMPFLTDVDALAMMGPPHGAAMTIAVLSSYEKLRYEANRAVAACCRES